MSLAEESKSNEESAEPVKLIPYQRGQIQYQRMLEPALPKQPETPIRRTGFWGAPDRQDVDQERTLRKIRYLAIRTRYIEAAATALEFKSVKGVTDAARQMESIAYGLPANSVAGMLARDAVGESITRFRLRRNLLMENFDDEAINSGRGG